MCVNYKNHTFDKERKWILDVNCTGYFDLQFIDYDNNFTLLKEIFVSHVCTIAEESNYYILI